MDNIRRKYREQAEALVGIGLFVSIVSFCCGLWVIGLIVGIMTTLLKVVFE